MAKYTIKLMQRASRDLDDIYNHIADDFKAIGTAEKMAGSIRKTGAFANRGYRQLFVKNFTIVYRIDEAGKMVIIVTVRYTPGSF